MSDYNESQGIKEFYVLTPLIVKEAYTIISIKCCRLSLSMMLKKNSQCVLNTTETYKKIGC